MTLTVKQMIPNYNRETDTRKVYRGTFGAIQVPADKVRAAIKMARTLIGGDGTTVVTPVVICDAYQDAARAYGIGFEFTPGGKRHWTYLDKQADNA